MEDQLHADTLEDDGTGEKKPKPWDTYFSKPAPEVAPEAQPDGWKLIHDGRLLEDALWAAGAELTSDLLWGNLALPINKTLEHLREIAELHKTPEADRSDEHINKEARLRRDCREMLELSTKQLEEMQEKKGEFGHEFRVVTAAWYMMMMPDTTLKSHLMAPVDASKAAWTWLEEEAERRRIAGHKWRTAREDECLFDEEAARRHLYELTQTRRRHELTITVPVPAKTRPSDVRFTLKGRMIRLTISTHPLLTVLDGELLAGVETTNDGGHWHCEGEFETRRVVLDLVKCKLADWPCLMLVDAPEEVIAERKKLSGANGEVDVYEHGDVLFQPQRSDKFFSWGEPPKAEERQSAQQRWRQGEIKGKGGGLPPGPPTETGSA